MNKYSMSFWLTIGMIAMSLDYVKSQEMICDASDSGSNSKLSISEQIDALITDEHLQAVNRRRRIIFQDDVLANGIFRNERVGEDRLERIIDYYMSRIDAHPNQIDSVWHEWGEGNTAVWPSRVLPRTRNVFPKWWNAGIDPVEVLLRETRKRGREVFFSYRINGSDNDDLFDPPHPFDQPIPLKAQHPDWLFYLWHTYWNFAYKQVRDLKLAIVREVAEMYAFDGIQIDFARIPVLFPAGQQWEHRNLLTHFMREVRLALLKEGKKRGRPFLLAARIPENLMGCHFDGMDVETWAREKLVDIFVLGTRTANVDIDAFRRITEGTSIKLYPCWDDHHSSDGYLQTGIKVFRGVYANWWHQRPDGMHTFNLMMASPGTAERLGESYDPRWSVQRKVFNEIGTADSLRGKDKIFFVERRGGGHGQRVVPSPSNWNTPRHMYFQTNMLAPLPVPLARDEREDRLFLLPVADDVNRVSDVIDTIKLRVLISGGDKEVSDSQELKSWRDRIRLRLNNIPLENPRIVVVPGDAIRSNLEWIVFEVPAVSLAVGANLVGVSMGKWEPSGSEPVLIEKIELEIDYHQE